MDNRLDIIIFGATGFTGKLLISEIYKVTQSDGRFLTWGVAGRSEEKLRNTLNEVERKKGINLSFVPILTANAEDMVSLKNMTAKTRLLLNCCGSYEIYGDNVITACIETNTHQLDISENAEYMEYMQLKYDKLARERGVYVVNCCGVDSIPADLGLLLLEKEFPGTLHSVDLYVIYEMDGVKGTTGNFGSWESVLYQIRNHRDLTPLRKQLMPKQPLLKTELKKKKWIHQCDVDHSWATPFSGPNGSILNRTQYYFYEKDNKKPIQVQCYFALKSLMSLICLFYYVYLLRLLTKFDWTYNLLLRHPKAFSGGNFSRQEPSENNLNRIRFVFTLKGKGLSNSVEDDDTQVPLTKTAQISGINPYEKTGVILGHAACVLLTEAKDLPKSGGVYTPGVMFAKTSLIEQLNKSGVTFTVLHN